MRRIICDIINSDEQFQATEICHDGLEAYELLQKKSFDAVILDVNMPRMDGLELLERLRQEQIEATVVIYWSLAHFLAFEIWEEDARKKCHLTLILRLQT